MVFDHINNAHLYYALHPQFKRAFDYVNQLDINTIAAGRYEIDGEMMYMLVQEYDSKLKEDGKWEAHRRYIDLQYVVKGAEGIGYANLRHLQPGEYDATKDFLPLQGEGDMVTLHSGSFVLLFPEDAHMPRLAVGAPTPVKKIVLKIAV
jgi:YhcH/YjgK/YiaL family protein